MHEKMTGLTQGMAKVAPILLTLAALLLVLAYNWVHTGALLARYITPTYVGYITAGGIELAIVVLSVQISRVKRQGTNPVFFYGVLIAVVLVSMLANLAEGYFSRYGEHLTTNNIDNLDIIQLVVWVTSTALLSLIVMALAEIAGQRATMLWAIDRVAQSYDWVATTSDKVAATGSKVDTKTLKQRALDYIELHPLSTPAEISHWVGCSESTARNAKRQYKKHLTA